LPEQKLNKDT